MCSGKTYWFVRVSGCVYSLSGECRGFVGITPSVRKELGEIFSDLGVR